MTIQFRCPHCEHKLRAPDTAAGQQARCKCARVVVVPRASEPEFAPPQAVAARPTAPPYSPGPEAGGWTGAISANPAPGGPSAVGRGRAPSPSAPASPAQRVLWPWYAGGAAVGVCLAAGVVLLFALTGKDRKPLLGIPLVGAPQTLWGVDDASVGTMTEDGRDISAAYSEDRGGGTMNLTPKEGARFIVIRCKLTARVADPQVVQNQVPRGTADHDQESRRALTGQYRRFDMALAAVVAPSGEKCPLVWPVDPAGRYTGRYALFYPTGMSMGGVDPKPPWHETYLRNDSFAGLLEVQQPVEVAFLVSAPWSLPLDGLELQIETDPPVPLRVRN